MKQNLCLYTPDEVATMLRVTRNSIQRWIRSGELPALQVGNQYRISQDDLDKFVHVVETKEGVAA